MRFSIRGFDKGDKKSEPMREAAEQAADALLNTVREQQKRMRENCAALDKAAEFLRKREADPPS
jgi:hypothetical protein